MACWDVVFARATHRGVQSGEASLRFLYPPRMGAGGLIQGIIEGSAEGPRRDSHKKHRLRPAKDV